MKTTRNFGGGEPCNAWIFYPHQIVGLDRSEDEEEEKGDDYVHQSRDRNREFLRRFLRHARRSPDGQQDVPRLDPEAPGHVDVAEFVEDDTGEDERNEEHAVARRGKPSLLPGAAADPGDEEKER